MRGFVITLVALLALATASLGCNFRYGPVAEQQFIRAEGWDLPGLDDVKPVEHPNALGLPMLHKIPGVTMRMLTHNEPYIIYFPNGNFLLNGIRQRLHPDLVKARIVRFEINGRNFAYSYGLTPVIAHQEADKWVVDDEMLCTYTGTFIDDKGDGVFRVFVLGSLMPEMIPAWAKRLPDGEPQ
jgi:hypothetical protein